MLFDMEFSPAIDKVPQKTILIVEDDTSLRETLCDFVETLYPDWRILEAANGRIGLEIAQSEHPDVIFFDFQMPIMNGYDMAVALQQNPQTAQIPLILISSESIHHPLIIRLRTMCKAMISKPFQLGELEYKLGQFMDTKPSVGFHRFSYKGNGKSVMAI